MESAARWGSSVCTTPGTTVKKAAGDAGVSADNLTRDHFFLTPNMKMRVGASPRPYCRGRWDATSGSTPTLSAEPTADRIRREDQLDVGFHEREARADQRLDDKHAKVEEYVGWFDEWEASTARRGASITNSSRVPRTRAFGRSSASCGRHATTGASEKMIFAQSRANQDVNEHHYAGTCGLRRVQAQDPNTLTSAPLPGWRDHDPASMRDEKTSSGGAPLDANVSGGLCKQRERPANTATAEFGDDGFDLTDLLKDLEAQEAAVAMDCD